MVNAGAFAGKCGCWIINVGIAVGLYLSIKSGNHEHQSCCLADECVTCFERNGESCSWPCDFPDEVSAPSAYVPDNFNGIEYDNVGGRCTYSATWESDDIFEGEKSRTWDFSQGCEPECLQSEVREEIYMEEDVEEKLTTILLVSMIFTVISVIPVIGSCLNCVADIVLMAIYFGISGFTIVASSTYDCQILYNFETGIVYLALLVVILDVINFMLDLGGALGDEK